MIENIRGEDFDITYNSKASLDSMSSVFAVCLIVGTESVEIPRRWLYPVRGRQRRSRLLH
jgi:hypothetical protein